MKYFQSSVWENKIEKWKREYTIFYCSIVLILFYISLKGMGKVVSLFSADLGYYESFFVKEFCAAVVAVLFAAVSRNLMVFKRKGTGIAKGFVVGLYYVVIGTLGLLAHLFLENVEPVWQPWHSIAAFFLCMICVGITEEVVFRGVIAEILYQKFGKDEKGIWCAVFLSGLFFGVIHMGNVSIADVTGVIVQSIAAIFSGMTFTAIYYRTGNIWVPVILHAYVDMSSLILSGLFGASSIEGTISSYSFFNLIGCVPYVIVLVVLLRKNKIEEIKRNMEY